MRWKLNEVESCASALDEARLLPPWTIVRAERQLKGRGRFNREWVADEGGLWASYNLPLEAPGDHPWGFLPLVAGVALMEALKEFAISGLRLRWPNDLLVGRAKLAGILVERPWEKMASVGIGVNVHNPVVDYFDVFCDQPTRLEDLTANCPSVGRLCTMVGESLAKTFDTFLSGGPEALTEELAAAWGEPRPVVVITDTERICGRFVGVARDGSPILQRADGTRVEVPGSGVLRLRELI